MLFELVLFPFIYTPSFANVFYEYRGGKDKRLIFLVTFKSEKYAKKDGYDHDVSSSLRFRGLYPFS